MTEHTNGPWRISGKIGDISIMDDDGFVAASKAAIASAKGGHPQP